MKVTWLTQAGLYFENSRIKILVDPYLSNSVGEKNPKKNPKSLPRITVGLNFLQT